MFSRGTQYYYALPPFDESAHAMSVGHRPFARLPLHKQTPVPRSPLRRVRDALTLQVIVAFLSGVMLVLMLQKGGLDWRVLR
jgi:hypothetical protein